MLYIYLLVSQTKSPDDFGEACTLWLEFFWILESMQHDYMTVRLTMAFFQIVFNLNNSFFPATGTY